MASLSCFFERGKQGGAVAAAMVFAAIKTVLSRLKRTSRSHDATRAALKQALGPFGYLWLSACAIYPALNFPLTVRIGRLLAARVGRPAPSENEVFALCRLDWFRGGRLPDELRGTLLSSLDQEIYRLVIDQINDRLTGGGAGLDGDDGAAAVARRGRIGIQSDGVFIDYRIGRPRKRGALALERSLSQVYRLPLSGWWGRRTATALIVAALMSGTLVVADWDRAITTRIVSALGIDVMVRPPNPGGPSLLAEARFQPDGSLLVIAAEGATDLPDDVKSSLNIIANEVRFDMQAKVVVSGASSPVGAAGSVQSAVRTYLLSLGVKPSSITMQTSAQVANIIAGNWALVWKEAPDLTDRRSIVLTISFPTGSTEIPGRFLGRLRSLAASTGRMSRGILVSARAGNARDPIPAIERSVERARQVKEAMVAASMPANRINIMAESKVANDSDSDRVDLFFVDDLGGNIKAPEFGRVQTSATAPVPDMSMARSPANGTTTIYFHPEDGKLPQEGEALLTDVAKAMAADNALRIEMVAYASAPPDGESKARRLSLVRALEVRKFLMERGVRSTRIEVRALGMKSDGGNPDRVDLNLRNDASSQAKTSVPAPTATTITKSEPVPAPTVAPALPQAQTLANEAKTIHFRPEDSKLPPGAETILESVFRVMDIDDALVVQLLAYAAAPPNGESKARRLSLSRALEVRSFLIEKGVRSTRIEVRALGNKSDGGDPDRVSLILLNPLTGQVKAPALVPAPVITPAIVPPAAAPSAPSLTDGVLTIYFSVEVTKLPDSASEPLGQLAKTLAFDDTVDLRLLAYASAPPDGASKARRMSLSRALEVRKF